MTPSGRSRHKRAVQPSLAGEAGTADPERRDSLSPFKCANTSDFSRASLADSHSCLPVWDFTASSRKPLRAREAEISRRLALGAQPNAVVRLVFHRVGVLVAGTDGTGSTVPAGVHGPHRIIRFAAMTPPRMTPNLFTTSSP